MSETASSAGTLLTGKICISKVATDCDLIFEVYILWWYSVRLSEIP